MKNKIFLGLILGIFLIGLVSASITGYLVSRGGALSTDGYKATLQKVEGTTAIVSVRTPTGDTELVRVAEGETAKVGEAEISASSLTRGTLFRRGGAEVEINVAPPIECNCYVYVGANPEKVAAENGQQIYSLNVYGQFIQAYTIGGIIPDEIDVSNGLWAKSMSCTRLEETGEQVYTMEQTFDILSEIERPVPFYSKECIDAQPDSDEEAVKEHTHLSDYEYVEQNLTLVAGNTLLDGKIKCGQLFGKDYIVLGGGYQITDALETGMITNGPIFSNTYQVTLNVLSQLNITGVLPSGKIYATCARIEPTLHQFGQDY